MKVRTGEIYRFQSAVAGKQKYHLCLSVDRHFIFLNSPKAKSFPGDIEIDSKEITGLTPTPEGKSIASCSLVLHFTSADLQSLGATKVGDMSVSALKDILVGVEDLSTIAPEIRDQIVDALADFIGT